MSRETIYTDPRIRQIQWRELVPVNVREIVIELLLPAAWLAVSVFAAAHGQYAIALALSFFFFLTGLRIVHNAFHRALGLPQWATEAVLWTMSVAMLGSMHAVRFNHLRHHALRGGAGDVEGRCGEMPAWSVLIRGPVFPFLLLGTALRYGSRRLRREVIGELLLNGLWIAFVFGPAHSGVLRYHVAAMAAGQCLSAFFAVWSVHHHCDRTHYIARTLRNRVKNRITFNMFLHVEHHLFPRVPTCHLPELSRRIDQAAPELKTRIVF